MLQNLSLITPGLPALEDFNEYSVSCPQRLPPETKGVYLCVKSDSEEVVYIGSATGQKGLRGRICRQHLNPKYLEKRQGKWSKKDAFQIENKSYLAGVQFIDKSMLRKKLGRFFEIPANQTKEFLWSNFKFFWFSSPHLSNEEVLSLEKKLIDRLRPVFNNRKL